MTDPAETLGIVTLPESIPIFPLSGVLLLPGGRLPLNIFEPRYLDMTTDALSGERIIGMVQPVEADAEARVDDPDIYDLGCAGRITAFEETDDGRYEIVLTGFCRFRILEEEPRNVRYRRARVDWNEFARDLATPDEVPIRREPLIRSLQAFLTHKGLSADWEALAELEDDEFVTWLSMYCPFRSSEKQALLECPDLTERARKLDTLMEMALHEDDAGELPHH